MNITITLVFSILAALLTVGGVVYASKAIEEGKKNPIEKSMGVALVAINLIAGVVAIALSSTFPTTSMIIAIVMLVALIILQAFNKQGRRRAASWNCFGGIYAIALALAIAGSFDLGTILPKLKHFLLLLLYIVVILVGIIRVKLYDRDKEEKAKKAIDWVAVIAVVCLVAIAIALVTALVYVLKS